MCAVVRVGVGVCEGVCVCVCGPGKLSPHFHCPGMQATFDRINQYEHAS